MAFIKTFSVSTIHDVYQGIRVLVIVSPIWSNHLLASDVPYMKLETMGLDGFYIKPLSRHDTIDLYNRSTSLLKNDRSFSQMIPSSDSFFRMVVFPALSSPMDRSDDA